MLIDNGVEYTLEKTMYVVVAAVGTGTVQLAISTDGLPYVDIPETSWSVDTVVNMTLPNCKLKATLTGTAKLSISDTRPSVR